MAHEIVAELGGNLRLQLLDLVGTELDHSPRVDIDQMIVMRRVGGLETRRRAFEGMALHDALLLER
ncbi:hypothetical protein D9M72_570330 [compost metagenome]